jgi:glycosyltransferase involved in cell wall biosynthesis
MNVGMLVWTFWPEPEGGAERQCRLVVEVLESRGHECTVLTSRVGLFSAGNRAAGARILRFGWLCPLEKAARHIVGTGDKTRLDAMRFWLMVPIVWLSRLSFVLSILLFASRHPSPVDVLHVHESGWLAGVGVAMGRLWRIPVLIKEATAPPLAPISYGTPGRSLWNRYRRQAAGYFAQTKITQMEMVKMGIPPSLIHLLPNGVECPPDSANPCTEEVLYVGNLTQGAGWKAFDVLFDAWVKVVDRRPDARLIAVGGGNAEPWVQWLKKQGIAHTVHFQGRVDDVRPYYARAGVFVLPSRVEGMSNALLEAQSWGLACVVSDIPANIAVIRHEVNGLIVPVNKSDALADGILKLLDNAGLRDLLGCEARRLMSTNHDIQRIVDHLIKIYESVQGGAQA